METFHQIFFKTPAFTGEKEFAPSKRGSLKKKEEELKKDKIPQN